MMRPVIGPENVVVRKDETGIVLRPLGTPFSSGLQVRQARSEERGYARDHHRQEFGDRFGPVPVPGSADSSWRRA